MDLAAAALARPRVRVNQAGYLADGPKAATVLTDRVAPIPYSVVSAGRTVWHGLSSPGPLPVLDFSGHRATGTFVIEAGGFASHPFPIVDELYPGLLRDALRFFYAQRSGMALDDAVLPGYGRPGGHAGVPPNRGDTDVDGLDVSGGWYDAGDHGKYVTSGALPASMLLAARERHPGPQVPAGPSLLEEARWQVDWLVRMQVPPGRPHAGLAYHRLHDDTWTPLPMWPHLDPARRVLHPPSTTAGLQLAAVAAHVARFDPAYLPAARAAWAAALREPALLAPDDAGAHGGRSRPRRGDRSSAARTRRTTRAGRAPPGSPGCPTSCATSTSRTPRPPMTSASAGTRRWYCSPPTCPPTPVPPRPGRSRDRPPPAGEQGARSPSAGSSHAGPSGASRGGPRPAGSW